MSLQPDIAMRGNPDELSASEIARAVVGHKMTAVSVTEAALARIAKHDSILNSFTDVTADRARARAASVTLTAVILWPAIARAISEADSSSGFSIMAISGCKDTGGLGFIG